MILAGDIGGTHSRLGLYSETGDHLHLQIEKIYPSRQHGGLAEIVVQFLADQNTSVNHAAFGIAGPILNGVVSTPNLPWVIDKTELSGQAKIQHVALINDLEAHAWGVDDLEPNGFATLNAGAALCGNAALIAAGTGLGEACLYWDGARRHPFACEGGHADFAPRNDVEMGLLTYLCKKFGRVSYERILSGRGLKNVYDFLRDSGTEREPPSLLEELTQAPDPAAVISKHGLAATAVICERALDIFVSVYGAEAGNLALKMLAIGGVFLSGGIAAHILPKLSTPAFMLAFVAKGRLQPLLEKIPVKVVTDDRIGLVGAARYALERLCDQPADVLSRRRA
ncbi:MAG TPA: glucokinase [Candidatus Angelobacter sp.]|nr:glucokinase [Candidatus Angelobacter sp.]